MVKFDDYGNIVDMEDDEGKDQQIVGTPQISRRIPKQYKAIILYDYEDKIEELEDKIEAFLNSSPKKEIISINFSHGGIIHYVLIIYKEAK